VHKTWLKSERQTPPATAGRTSVGGTLARSVLILAVLSCGGYLLWRRTQRTKEAQPQKHTHIRVLSGTQIGPKARAVVADVGGRLILLGVTEHSVRRLAWLESATEDTAEPEKSRSGVRSEGDTLATRATTNAARDNRETTVRRQSPSRFSEVLRDAVGMKSKRDQEPALVLANSTRDHVAINRAAEQALQEAQYVDVEGQAAGLVARLNRKT
jgi:flagellar biogenesis protein FliO